MTEHLHLIARQLTHLQRMREYLAHSVRRCEWASIGQLAGCDRANGEFIPDNPLARHSRAGGNPARINTPRVCGCCKFIGFTTTAYPLLVRGQNGPLAASFEERPNRDVAPLRGRFLIIWIPACAGMTQFCADGLSEFMQVFA